MGISIRPGVAGGAITGPGLTRGSAIVSGGPALAASARAVASPVLVDLDEGASKAKIIRGGKEVTTPVTNVGRASAVLENFVPVIRFNEPRSVRQSIVPGTLVARGTSVDVEFLTPDLVTLGIFEGVHADLLTRTPVALASLLVDPEVSPLLDKNLADLSPAQRTNLTAKLAAANVGVDDAVPDRSLGAALAGLKTALAFR